MASVAVISAAVPGFAQVIEAAFATVAVLAALVPSASAGRRVRAAVVARRRFRALAEPGAMSPAPEAPTLAELRRSA